jgi:hypothetical protein
VFLQWIFSVQRLNNHTMSNPKPRAPFNPFDPTEARPPQGYPSEYLAPTEPRGWSKTPKDASKYEQARAVMRQIKYDPRPPSEKYPGQFKKLRRVNTSEGFMRGIKLTGKVLTVSVLGYGVFFMKWDNGYENVFSPFYRARIRLKGFLTGSLTEQEQQDLIVKERGYTKLASQGHNPVMPGGNPGHVTKEVADLVYERPQQRHMVAAEKKLLAREEAILRAVDIAEAEMAKKNTEKKGWW